MQLIVVGIVTVLSVKRVQNSREIHLVNGTEGVCICTHEEAMANAVAHGSPRLNKNVYGFFRTNAK